MTALLSRQLRHLANAMQNGKTLPDAGVITIKPRHSLMLSRTHFHIFGLFFPITMPRTSASAALVVDLYRSVNLTSKVAAPMSTGSDVIVIPVSRDRGAADDVTTSVQRWPGVFEKHAKTLRR